MNIFKQLSAGLNSTTSATGTSQTIVQVHDSRVRTIGDVHDIIPNPIKIWVWEQQCARAEAIQTSEIAHNIQIYLGLQTTRLSMPPRVPRAESPRAERAESEDKLRVRADDPLADAWEPPASLAV